MTPYENHLFETISTVPILIVQSGLGNGTFLFLTKSIFE